MSCVVDFTFFVDQKDKRNTLNLEVLDKRMSTVPTQKCQVLNLGPSFCVNSVFDDLFIIINADCNNSRFSFPFLLIFLKHFLVVFHWVLARSTPSGPNIDQQNFSWLMNYLRLLLRKDSMKVFVVRAFFNQLPTFVRTQVEGSTN
jgi:hypothetical protein